MTPVECERLQTLPDNYTEIGLKEEYIAILSEKSLKNSKKELGLTDRYTRISNTQRYKCIGNGWTVDVIAHIFSFMDEAGEVEYKPVNIFEWVKTFRKRA